MLAFKDPLMQKCPTDIFTLLRKVLFFSWEIPSFSFHTLTVYHHVRKGSVIVTLRFLLSTRTSCDNRGWVGGGGGGVNGRNRTQEWPLGMLTFSYPQCCWCWQHPVGGRLNKQAAWREKKLANPLPKSARGTRLCRISLQFEKVRLWFKELRSSAKLSVSTAQRV